METEPTSEHIRLGQQLYAVFETCKKPEALWDKLSTGHYDWLGVREGGRYLLGRPRLSPIRVDDWPSPDEERHRHRVECRAPLARRPHWESFATPEEAKEAFARMVCGDPVTPLRASGAWKMRLVLDGRPSSEDVLVVRTLPRVV